MGKTRFIHSYGSKYLITWFNLRKLGLLIVKSQRLLANMSNIKSSAIENVVSLVESGNCQKLIKEFNLIPNEIESFKGKLSRTTAGVYTPLSVKLVENILEEKKFKDNIKNLLAG